jgi:hypothetical protein
MALVRLPMASGFHGTLTINGTRASVSQFVYLFDPAQK